ncbi:MAG: hypothetical protein FWE36_08850 [Erysipelotrichales bacterium]|nr:hypothetical protein [Erysipelotrichales bacterium]
MSNDEKASFIKWISYFVPILLIILTVEGIIDRVWNYNLFLLFESGTGRLIFTLILLGVIPGFGGLLLVKFNFIGWLDSIFFPDETSEEKKYFKILDNEVIQHSRSLIFSSLLATKDDSILLKPILNHCEYRNFEKAVSMGYHNGHIYHTLSKTYVRVINGIISLYAIEQREKKGHLERYEYAKHHILINDLGWSLANLDEESMKKVRKFFVENPNYGAFVLNEFDSIFDQELGKKNIKKSYDEIDRNKFKKLFFQSWRHLLYLDKDNNHDQWQKDFNDFEKKIDNIKKQTIDKKEIIAQSKLLKAQVFITDALGEIKNNLIILKEAEDIFEKLMDDDRLLKCYFVRGILNLKLYQYNRDSMYRKKALNCFSKGYEEAKKISRIDQQIKNLIKLSSHHDKRDERFKYAEEGLELATRINNSKLIKKFKILKESDEKNKESIELKEHRYNTIPDDLIVFISGVPGVGKTTISYQLLKKFNVFRIIEETDILRDILRGYNRFIEESSANGDLVILPEIPDNNTVLTFEMAQQQCLIMKASIENIIIRQKRKKIPSIINGVHIVPETFNGIFDNKGIIYINLYVNNEKELEKRLFARDKDSYLLNHISSMYETNRLLNISTNSEIIKNAGNHILNLDVTDLTIDETVVRIMDFIVNYCQ